MSEGSITNKIHKVLDDFYLKYRIEKQTSYIETLQFEEEKYRPHQTWNFNEENFVCYEEDETHTYILTFFIQKTHMRQGKQIVIIKKYQK